jgi:hypothetical protein
MSTLFEKIARRDSSSNVKPIAPTAPANSNNIQSSLLSQQQQQQQQQQQDEQQSNENGKCSNGGAANALIDADVDDYFLQFQNHSNNEQKQQQQQQQQQLSLQSLASSAQQQQNQSNSSNLMNEFNLFNSLLTTQPNGSCANNNKLPNGAVNNNLNNSSAHLLDNDLISLSLSNANNMAKVNTVQATTIAANNGSTTLMGNENANTSLIAVANNHIQSQGNDSNSSLQTSSSANLNSNTNVSLNGNSNTQSKSSQSSNRSKHKSRVGSTSISSTTAAAGQSANVNNAINEFYNQQQNYQQSLSQASTPQHYATRRERSLDRSNLLDNCMIDNLSFLLSNQSALNSTSTATTPRRVNQILNQQSVPQQLSASTLYLNSNSSPTANINAASSKSRHHRHHHHRSNSILNGSTVNNGNNNNNNNNNFSNPYSSQFNPYASINSATLLSNGVISSNQLPGSTTSFLSSFGGLRNSSRALSSTNFSNSGTNSVLGGTCQRDPSINSIKSLINQLGAQSNSINNLNGLGLNEIQQPQLQQTASTSSAISSKLNFIKELQIKLMDMQKECYYLRCELDATQQKLSSSMQSIKQFWCPELKKERHLRKEETAKYTLLLEQYKLMQVQYQSLLDSYEQQAQHVQQLKMQLQQQQQDEMLNSNTSKNLMKEKNLLKKTINELELRISTQKTTLVAKDETIKKLFQLVKSLTSTTGTTQSKSGELEFIQQQMTDLEIINNQLDQSAQLNEQINQLHQRLNDEEKKNLHLQQIVQQLQQQMKGTTSKHSNVKYFLAKRLIIKYI